MGGGGGERESVIIQLMEKGPKLLCIGQCYIQFVRGSAGVKFGQQEGIVKKGCNSSVSPRNTTKPGGVGVVWGGRGLGMVNITFAILGPHQRIFVNEIGWATPQSRCWGETLNSSVTIGFQRGRKGSKGGQFPPFPKCG